jgi:hypothetical protein
MAAPDEHALSEQALTGDAERHAHHLCDQHVPLADFLLSLLNNPAKLRAFREAPEALLESANLTWEEKDALRSGDAERIKAQLAKVSAAQSTGVAD